MKKLAVGFTLLLVAGAAPVAATVIEIPLPAHHGTYPVDASTVERTAAFTLPSTPVVVNSVSIRVSGTTGVGELLCEGGGSAPWPMDISAAMSDPAMTHSWYAFRVMPDVAGAFGWTTEFRASPPSGHDWGFLMDGAASVTLYGLPAALVGLCSPTSPPPTAILTEAVLVVDAEFAVPVREMTWGRIRALYGSE